MRNQLTPTPLYSKFTPEMVNVVYESGVNYVSGGVYKIEKLVIVAVRLNLTAVPSSGRLATGLPVPKADGSYTSPYVRSVTINGSVAIDANGYLIVYNAEPSTIIINLSYIAN